MSPNALKIKSSGSGIGLRSLPVGHVEEALKRVIPTGLESVDRLLPQGGLPRGHLCEMVGERGSGRTSFVLNLVSRLAKEGERTAIIDLDWDLDPSSFSQVGVVSGAVWVVFPSRLEDALWAADLLLRSGHFSLVVLDGLEESVRTAAFVRLQRQARDTDTAFLIGSRRRSYSAPGSLQLRFSSGGVEWERGLNRLIGPQRVSTSLSVSKRQGSATAHFDCQDGTLLGKHHDVPDRRAAKWTEAA